MARCICETWLTLWPRHVMFKCIRLPPPPPWARSRLEAQVSQHRQHCCPCNAHYIFFSCRMYFKFSPANMPLYLEKVFVRSSPSSSKYFVQGRGGSSFLSPPPALPPSPLEEPLLFGSSCFKGDSIRSFRPMRPTTRSKFLGNVTEGVPSSLVLIFVNGFKIRRGAMGYVVVRQACWWGQPHDCVFCSAASSPRAALFCIRAQRRTCRDC